MQKRQATVTFNPETSSINDPSFTVFTHSDFSPDGKKVSTYPSWYFDGKREELENTITVMKNAIKLGYVMESRIAEYKENIKKLEKRLAEMDDAIPKIDTETKDFIAKTTKSMSEKISNAMPTRDEMEKNLVLASELARRMGTPCISLNKDEIRWGIACGLQVGSEIVNEKTSLNNISFMWKIARKILGENTNVEVLRK